MNEVFAHYLKRHAELRHVCDTLPHDCTMVVVIPVHNEPDLVLTLNSLAQCVSPQCHWTVLLVVNDCHGDAPEIHQQNQQTLSELQNISRCPIATIDATGVPDGKGGVGAARKIGMDATIAAFARANHDGIVVSLDADCTVNRNYLVALECYFLDHPTSPACVTRFCHPLDAAPNHAARMAMVHYELHLRYYQLGLQHAEVPYAFSTIGSCFACRASDYARQGGMNRRQAGEDFYFLHKMAQRGSVGHCYGAVVYPSPRVSSRTPFGTGQAMAKWLTGDQSEWESYHPQAFIDLAAMVKQIDTMVAEGGNIMLAPSMHSFFQQQYGIKHLAEIRRNTASQTAFRKRFWHWFNGFLTMKFIRFACNQYHGWMPVEHAITTLLHRHEAMGGAEALLTHLRQKERCHPKTL